jgi:signal transduction histidine kinase
MERLDAGSGISPTLDEDGIGAKIASLEARVAALTEANLNLTEQQQAHSASLAHLSHELRTPLTSILGFSEILLSQEELTAAQHNFVKRIQNSAQQLQNSLNQLSMMYRARTGPADGSQNRER